MDKTQYDRIVGRLGEFVPTKADGEVHRNGVIEPVGAVNLTDVQVLQRVPISNQHVGVYQGSLDALREGRFLLGRQRRTNMRNDPVVTSENAVFTVHIKQLSARGVPNPHVCTMVILDLGNIGHRTVESDPHILIRLVQRFVVNSCGDHFVHVVGGSNSGDQFFYQQSRNRRISIGEVKNIRFFVRITLTQQTAKSW